MDLSLINNFLSTLPLLKGGARSAGGFVAAAQVYEFCGVRFRLSQRRGMLPTGKGKSLPLSLAQLVDVVAFADLTGGHLRIDNLIGRKDRGLFLLHIHNSKANVTWHVLAVVYRGLGRVLGPAV